MFKTQKEVKYAPKNWINEGRLAFEFPTIQDKFRELGLGYISAGQEECNLSLEREFYANWDTSFGESNKLKIQGQVFHFTYKRFNAFLEKPMVYLSECFILLEGTPYQDILFVVSTHQPIRQWIIMTLA
ncbi:hypothetical protein HAX54_009513 [Datura stramonium]|uniref:Uncharacterized protein n=1 Tax=Datura stramonium TaxID=4076 RepID=A0ABS8TGL6_DATST|nr:hypothetical protein [Datura stramonium]